MKFWWTRSLAKLTTVLDLMGPVAWEESIRTTFSLNYLAGCGSAQVVQCRAGRVVGNGGLARESRPPYHTMSRWKIYTMARRRTSISRKVLFAVSVKGKHLPSVPLDLIVSLNQLRRTFCRSLSRIRFGGRPNTKPKPCAKCEGKGITVIQRSVSADEEGSTRASTSRNDLTDWMLFLLTGGSWPSRSISSYLSRLLWGRPEIQG